MATSRPNRRKQNVERKIIWFITICVSRDGSLSKAAGHSRPIEAWVVFIAGTVDAAEHLQAWSPPSRPIGQSWRGAPHGRRYAVRGLMAHGDAGIWAVTPRHRPAVGSWFPPAGGVAGKPSTRIVSASSFAGIFQVRLGVILARFYAGVFRAGLRDNVGRFHSAAIARRMRASRFDVPTGGGAYPARRSDMETLIPVP